MTAATLRSILKDVPDDMEVVLHDGEGWYSPGSSRRMQLFKNGVFWWEHGQYDLAKASGLAGGIVLIAQEVITIE